MFVRNGTEMAPVSQFVTLNKVLGPETANRFNLYSAIAANVNPAEGYSSGEVQKVIAEVAEQTLPLGYGYEYGGMAREEANTGGAQTVFIYAICIFLIYLILACLYESFLIPFAVIFSVPFGLMGSFLFAKVLGLENNIYLQTGVIMLIGLLAKTAILITEYAIERRRKGMGIVESAYSAAQVRLRPILMTVLTMIFGMLPLMFSSGAGANGNSSLGTGVVGGMLIGTLALLFVVPVFYIIFEYLQEKVRPQWRKKPICRYCLKSRRVRQNGRKIEENKIKTDWNNEETYHPIVRRRFAVQQLRRVHQIQTCYRGPRRPLRGRNSHFYGEHRRFSGGSRRQPGPWPGRHGLARAFHRPTSAGTHRTRVAEQYRLPVGTAPRGGSRSYPAVRKACLPALLCPCAAGHGEQL